MTDPRSNEFTHPEGNEDDVLSISATDPTAFDIRYEHLTCAQCRRKHQVMGWRFSPLHNTDCGGEPPAVLEMESHELSFAVAAMKPGMGSIRYDIGIYPPGHKREVTLPVQVAALVLMKRHGVEGRIL